MIGQNIVKLDRTTVQEYLPMLTHRGVFSNYDNLPMKEELINEEKIKLGVSELTLQQERDLLSSVGKYRSKAYVVRDYGDYVIAFSAKLYIDNLTNTEQELKEEALLEEYGEKRIQEALKKINTYKLAHKIAIIILGEVYNQKKSQDLVITKHELLKKLGYCTKDKYIYADINEAINSLRWLDYIVYNYNTKLKLKEESKTTGNFIYNLSENSIEYRLWINPIFVGCVIHMAEDGGKLSKETQQLRFNRGYLEYPLDFIAESKTCSDGAYYLGHYLLTQNGNPKLNTKEQKVITITFKNLLEQSKIKHPRRNKRVSKVLDALEEIAHIQLINPPIEELRKMPSKRVEQETLHIYIDQQ